MGRMKARVRGRSKGRGGGGGGGCVARWGGRGQVGAGRGQVPSSKHPNQVGIRLPILQCRKLKFQEEM